MPENLEVRQRENGYRLIKTYIPNVITVGPDTSWGEGGRQDAIVRAESVWRGGGWLHRGCRLAQVSPTFREAFDLFLHDS